MVGSKFAVSKIFPIKLVVVVLPCEPATAIDFLLFISSANISALLTTGIESRLQATISILFFLIAEENTATEIALEKWRVLSNHIEGGGSIFEKTAIDNLEEYNQYLEDLYKTDQIKKKTIATKRCSLKKLRLRLEIYNKLSEVPINFLADYVTWRRTKNWDRGFHKNNPKPPSDLTINTELKDFKGFQRI